VKFGIVGYILYIFVMKSYSRYTQKRKKCKKKRKTINYQHVHKPSINILCWVNSAYCCVIVLTLYFCLFTLEWQQHYLCSHLTWWRIACNSAVRFFTFKLLLFTFIFSYIQAFSLGLDVSVSSDLPLKRLSLRESLEGLSLSLV